MYLRTCGSCKSANHLKDWLRKSEECHICGRCANLTKYSSQQFNLRFADRSPLRNWCKNCKKPKNSPETTKKNFFSFLLYYGNFYLNKSGDLKPYNPSRLVSIAMTVAFKCYKYDIKVILMPRQTFAT
jgi:hypothetical protein